MAIEKDGTKYKLWYSMPSVNGPAMYRIRWGFTNRFVAAYRTKGALAKGLMKLPEDAVVTVQEVTVKTYGKAFFGTEEVPVSDVFKEDSR